MVIFLPGCDGNPLAVLALQQGVALHAIAEATPLYWGPGAGPRDSEAKDKDKDTTGKLPQEQHEQAAAGGKVNAAAQGGGEQGKGSGPRGGAPVDEVLDRRVTQRYNEVLERCDGLCRGLGTAAGELVSIEAALGALWGEERGREREARRREREGREREGQEGDGQQGEKEQEDEEEELERWVAGGAWGRRPACWCGLWRAGRGRAGTVHGAILRCDLAPSVPLPVAVYWQIGMRLAWVHAVSPHAPSTLLQYTRANTHAHSSRSRLLGQHFHWHVANLEFANAAKAHVHPSTLAHAVTRALFLCPRLSDQLFHWHVANLEFANAAKAHVHPNTLAHAKTRALFLCPRLSDQLFHWHVANLEFANAAKAGALSLRHWAQVGRQGLGGRVGEQGGGRGRWSRAVTAFKGAGAASLSIRGRDRGSNASIGVPCTLPRCANGAGYHLLPAACLLSAVLTLPSLHASKHPHPNAGRRLRAAGGPHLPGGWVSSLGSLSMGQRLGPELLHLQRTVERQNWSWPTISPAHVTACALMPASLYGPPCRPRLRHAQTLHLTA